MVGKSTTARLAGVMPGDGNGSRRHQSQRDHASVRPGARPGCSLTSLRARVPPEPREGPGPKQTPGPGSRPLSVLSPSELVSVVLGDVFKMMRAYF